MKRLDVYIDESGDLSPYSKSNPLYAVSFVLCEDHSSCEGALRTFHIHKAKSPLKGDFVHVDPLVRNEPPYKGELREERQRLFYGLYLLAQHAPVRFMSIRLEKTPRMNLETALANALFETLDAKRGFFSKFDEIVLHYDNGQPFLTGIILGAFRSESLNARYEKTIQSEHPFMQVADLLGEMELIRYHCELNLLTKSEISFFGEKRKIKKDYLKPLDRKTI